MKRRREFLRASALACSATMAGCSGESSEEGTPSNTATNNEATATERTKATETETETETPTETIEFDPELSLDPGPKDWPIRPVTAANHAHHPSSTGPTSNFDEVWTSSLGDDPTRVVVANGTVFCRTKEGELHALSTTDGSMEWQLTDSVKFGRTPGVYNETVVVGGRNGSVYGLDASTGGQQWTFDVGEEVGGNTISDGTAYAWNGNNELYAISIATGDKKWEIQGGTGIYRVSVAGNYLIHIDFNSVLYIHDTTDGSKHWTFDLPYREIGAGPVVTEDIIYLGTGSGVHALDPGNGERWSFDTGDKVSSLAFADETVFAGTNSDNLYALDATDGAERWSYQLDGGAYPRPVVVDGTVYVGSSGKYFETLSVADGSQQGKYANVGARTNVAVVDGYAYVGSLQKMYKLE